MENAESPWWQSNNMNVLLSLMSLMWTQFEKVNSVFGFSSLYRAGDMKTNNLNPF